MRKTSQDGGDTTSVTSGIENEIKKPGAILKTKRNSVKRKVQNFSHESDETVIEPLLQKDKEKTDTLNQSAKYNLLSKTKTDSNSDRGSEKDKLIQDDKLSTANVSNVKDSTISTSMKDATALKFTTTGPLHNHMNTNMFSSHDAGKGFVAPKTQILVEIDGSKQGGYSPSPLIFTTAKIHTDGKTMHMEPVQVTPAPILSTIEVSMLKSGSIKGETSGIVNSNKSAVYSTTAKNNIIVTEKDQKTFKTVDTPTPSYIVGTKVLISGDKTTVTSNEQTKNSISSLATKDPTTNQIKLNSNNLIKDSLMGNKSIGENVHQNKVTPQALKSTIIDETKPSNVTCEPTKLVGIVSTKTHLVNDPCKSDGNVNQVATAAKTKTDDSRNPEKQTESINNPTAIGSVKAHKSDNVYLTKLTTPQTSNSTILDKTKKSVVTCDPTKLVGAVNTKVHSINDSCKNDGNDNKALTAAKTKSDDNPEKKTESSYNPNAFAFVKPHKSDVKKNTDKTTLNSTTATNSRQLQRQNIVIDSEDPNNLKLEPHINPSATKNTNVSSEKNHESQKSSSTAKNATPIKSSGNDSLSSSDGTTLPKQSANNVPVRSVPISTAASVNKTAALKYTPALVHKSSPSDTTTTATNKTSASIGNTVPTKNPPTSANNSQVGKKSTTAITTAVSKLPTSIASTTSVKKSPVNTTTTVDDYKSSSPINAAVSVNKTKTTDVSKKVPTSIPTSSVKTDNTSSTGTTSLNQINSKSTVFTTSKTEPSATTKNNAADAIILSSAITSGTKNLKSTSKAPVTSIVIAKSTASTSNTPSKALTNTAVQPNAASAIKSPTGIKSPIAATSKSLTQPKTVSKLDNAKESLSGSGKTSTSKINTTVAPGITNVTSNVSTTTTAINSSHSSSKATASNKKSDAKSNELSNGSQILKG